MGTISEKQFLEAVDIIKQYQIQMELKLSQIEHSNKTTIERFLFNYRNDIYTFEMSRRLLNILHNIVDNPQYYRSGVKYIEDFTKKNFLRIRTAGLKTWYEFEEILNKLKK